MHLVSLDMDDSPSRHERMPPVWIDYWEKAQMILPRLKGKINDLKSLHSRHLHRSTFDDNPDDEIAIDNCTREISRMFNEIHRLLQIIKSHSTENDMKEQRLTINIYQALAGALQDLSYSFRLAVYLVYWKMIFKFTLGWLQVHPEPLFKTIAGKRRQVKNVLWPNSRIRPGRWRHWQLLCQLPEGVPTTIITPGRRKHQVRTFLGNFTGFWEFCDRFAQEREKEVNAIVKSILDLNDIFKDLSQMVLEQGTVLDRIDYNIENTQVQVFEGFKQLQKADAYQRKNRKMCAIVSLAAVTILLLFILIIVKS